jgi:imidazolonepropionase-like amidohydrolase
MAGAEHPTRRGLLAGVAGLAAAPGVARAAFPEAVKTSGGTLTSPPPASTADSHPADPGGWLDAAPGAFSFQNARILVGDGTELRGGIRVEAGKIAEVGPGVRTGVDLGGATVFPGFFDGGSALGLYEIDLETATHDESEGSDGAVPAVRAEESYNPLSALIPVARRQGVLGGLVMPTGGAVSGQAAWMRFAGSRVTEATMLPAAGVVIQFGRAGTGTLGNQARSRMGLLWKLREVLDANKPPEPPDPKAKKGKKEEPPKPEVLTRTQQAWRAVRARELKVILQANRADDILAALALAKEYDLDAVMAGCAEGHLVARELADSGATVLIAPATTQPGDWETLHARYENAAELHAAGVPLVLRAGGPHNVRELPTEAVVAVAAGLPYGAAIAAACGFNAAKRWALPVGSLGVGRPATFAVAAGDPIEPRTRILRAFIDGREVSLRSRQSDLLDRFRILE